MKLRIAKLVLGLGFTLLAGIAFLSLPFSPNLGLAFGYYGQLNDVRGAIAEEPSLEVIDIWMHRDIDLEDFGITARTESGRTFTLTIVDGGRIRTASDRGNGVLIIGKKPRTTRVFAASDTGFWQNITDAPPASIAELLPSMDAFLAAVDASIFGLQDLPWSAEKEYIHVHYQSPVRVLPTEELLPAND